MGGGERPTLVDDAYDAAAISTWEYGSSVVGDDTYGGIGSSASVRWGVRTQKLNLAAGDYVFTQLLARIAFTGNADNDQCAFVLYEKDGTDLVEVVRYDLTSQKTNNASTHTATYDLSNLSVTIESGKEYQFGLAQRGAVTRSSNRPGWRRRNSGWSNEESTSWDGTAGVTTLPATISPTFGTSTAQFGYQLTFTTKNRIVFSGSIVSAMIPRRTDGVSSIKIDSFVGDATASVITLRDSDVSSGAVDRLVLNVDHTAETISFAGTSQALVGQQGDTFDFMTQVNGTAANLLYLNRTDGQGGEGVADIATISHRAKDTGSRGGSYTLGASTFRFATFSGGGTIGNVEIGIEPIVIFGDSMASYSGRLGQYLPSAFTYPKINWRAQISGNRLTVNSTGNHTAGYLRYKNTTVGLGDLCEIRDCVFCVAMYGLNDISRIGTGSADAVTADYFDKLESIIDDLLSNENQPLIAGLAPYSHPSNTSTQEAQAIVAWIELFADLAVEKRVAWMTPWWDLVDRSTVHDDIPEIRADYTSDGGTHINTTAVLDIVPLIVDAYESGIVGGPWRSSLKRFRHN